MGMIIVGGVVITILVFFTAIILRRVVATNEVHIIQSSRNTISYGKDTGHGNSYYEFPSWVPVFGVSVVRLPVSVFDIRLNSYEAYDKGRVPFVVDIIAFFRVDDSNLAAQRVKNFNELKEQLTSVVQGAIRTVLASHDIDEIMIERSKFGQHFTSEVEAQLKSWGVASVKNVELMDIRDSNNGVVIHNIMEKKKSLIEMQSRSEVAENKKKAQIAEIEAQRETEIQKQNAIQSIGQRTADQQKEVGISQQKSAQAVTEEKIITKQKEMEVVRVEEVKRAEISKNVGVVKAEQDKDVLVITADGELEAKKRESLAIQLEGEARADAEKKMQLAPVEAQIVLAKEIGENSSYQNYLITIRQIEASQVVGVEQSKALEKADVKIISNSGDPVSGVSSIRDIFSAKGGTSIGAMLEGLAQTHEGKAILSAVQGKKS